MRLLDSIANSLRVDAGLRPGDGLVVAFSGGGDSTALLWALTRLRPVLDLTLVAAHLDHGLDPGSAARARAAAVAAARLGVAAVLERAPPHAATGGRGLEAEARLARYRFLEQVRRRLGYRFVATGHHREDQAETVLLRARFGSGPLGLAAIQRRRGAIVRPLLDLTRAELRAALVEAGIDWTEDPTNRDLRRPRNRLRAVLAAAAAPGEAQAIERLARLADRARGAREAVEQRLLAELDVRPEFGGASAELSAMRDLPAPLHAPALALLHRLAGADYPASRGAASELARQLRAGDRPCCDCGAGWRWETRGSRLRLERRRPRPPEPPGFTYTVSLPGEIEVKELALRFRLYPRPALPRDIEISPRRAALALSPELGSGLTVRSRRPGDRIRPLGWDQSCRVKDLLINRKVSRHERHRLPLLASGDTVIWIPGVTVDHRFAAAPGSAAWIAEIDPREPAATGGAETARNPL